VRLIGYVRVSTKGQAERFGPEDQERDIRAWCRANGHRLTRVERELGRSGKQGASGLLAPELENGITTRPTLSRVLADIESGQADGIVVHDWTRLSRQVMWQELITYRLTAKGRHVLVVRGNDDGLDDATRRLLRTVMGAIAEYEHALLVARLQGGRQVKRSEGGYAYGAPPFGWRAEDRTLVEVPDEQATLARIRELHEQGSSLRAIAAVLEAEGHHPRRGPQWRPNTLSRILERM
jgi:DNA invertase Pin-like site-specific DNA recombinase